MRTLTSRCLRIVAPRAVAGALAAIALIGMSAADPASAQSPHTAGPISLGDLFKGPDSVDLKDGKDVVLKQHVDNASMRQCRTQKANIKVVVATTSDPTYQAALGTARRDVIDAVLKKQGVSAERYAVDYGGMGAKADVQVEHGEIIPDKDRPKLDTTSDPPNGTKVKANQKITVTMAATDRANQWQTGIKSIQLQDISTNPNGILVPQPADYGRLPDPCNAATMQRTHVVTYTVPREPLPPIIRLRAIAEDFAGNIGTDILEFSTGDWQGQFKFNSDGVVSGVRTTITDSMDLALTYDGRGNLTGTLAGTRSFKQDARECPFEVTIPGMLRGKLVGSYTPGANVMSIELVDPEVGPTLRRNCPGGGYVYSGFSIHEDANFKNVLRNPRLAADGTFRSGVVWMTGPITNSFTLTLRRARD